MEEYSQLYIHVISVVVVIAIICVVAGLLSRVVITHIRLLHTSENGK